MSEQMIGDCENYTFAFLGDGEQNLTWFVWKKNSYSRHMVGSRDVQKGEELNHRVAPD